MLHAGLWSSLDDYGKFIRIVDKDQYRASEAIQMAFIQACEVPCVPQTKVLGGEAAVPRRSTDVRHPCDSQGLVEHSPNSNPPVSCSAERSRYSLQPRAFLPLGRAPKHRRALARASVRPSPARCWSRSRKNEIAFLGVQTSPSFVREPEGNGCAERFIRTLKENLLWVRHFSTIEDLRLALLEFRDRYNHRWIIERHGYKTPEQARNALTATRKAA